MGILIKGSSFKNKQNTFSKQTIFSGLFFCPCRRRQGRQVPVCPHPSRPLCSRARLPLESPSPSHQVNPQSASGGTSSLTRFHCARFSLPLQAYHLNLPCLLQSSWWRWPRRSTPAKQASMTTACLQRTSGSVGTLPCCYWPTCRRETQSNRTMISQVASHWLALADLPALRLLPATCRVPDCQAGP